MPKNKKKNKKNKQDIVSTKSAISLGDVGVPPKNVPVASDVQQQEEKETIGLQEEEPTQEEKQKDLDAVVSSFNKAVETLQKLSNSEISSVPPVSPASKKLKISFDSVTYDEEASSCDAIKNFLKIIYIVRARLNGLLRIPSHQVNYFGVFFAKATQEIDQCIHVFSTLCGGLTENCTDKVSDAFRANTAEALLNLADFYYLQQLCRFLQSLKALTEQDRASTDISPGMANEKQYFMEASEIANKYLELAIPAADKLSENHPEKYFILSEIYFTYFCNNFCLVNEGFGDLKDYYDLSLRYFSKYFDCVDSADMTLIFEMISKRIVWTRHFQIVQPMDFYGESAALFEFHEKLGKLMKRLASKTGNIGSQSLGGVDGLLPQKYIKFLEDFIQEIDRNIVLKGLLIKIMSRYAASNNDKAHVEGDVPEWVEFFGYLEYVRDQIKERVNLIHSYHAIGKRVDCGMLTTHASFLNEIVRTLKRCWDRADTIQLTGMQSIQVATYLAGFIRLYDEIVYCRDGESAKEVVSGDIKTIETLLNKTSSMVVYLNLTDQESLSYCQSTFAFEWVKSKLLLNDPINGDFYEQVENTLVYGNAYIESSLGCFVATFSVARIFILIRERIKLIEVLVNKFGEGYFVKHKKILGQLGDHIKEVARLTSQKDKFVQYVSGLFNEQLSSSVVSDNYNFDCKEFKKYVFTALKNKNSMAVRLSVNQTINGQSIQYLGDSLDYFWNDAFGGKNQKTAGVIFGMCQAVLSELTSYSNSISDSVVWFDNLLGKLSEYKAVPRKNKKKKKKKKSSELDNSNSNNDVEHKNGQSSSTQVLTSLTEPNKNAILLEESQQSEKEEDPVGKSDHDGQASSDVNGSTNSENLNKDISWADMLSSDDESDSESKTETKSCSGPIKRTWADIVSGKLVPA